MEGNFYVSNTVVDHELKSKYGSAYLQCPKESATYGKCVEAAQINRVIKPDCCISERAALRVCVNRHLKEMGKPAIKTGQGL